ncbi:uncharacterized protein LOC107360157 [Tetranychus urticae]|uniref:uncharacterized protein LOC107360157 n=1 Tax=Tetranychus urticae TaxID=32264 RepID=UPI00077BBF39|nr:uncharacterized protein LOC107360157 [Tetranychus urticae]
MHLIIQLILFITFKLGSTIPVSNDGLDGQHEPRVSYDRISGHSESNVKVENDDKSIRKRSSSTLNVKLNKHLFPLGSTSSLSSLAVDVDGFKLVKSANDKHLSSLYQPQVNVKHSSLDHLFPSDSKDDFQIISSNTKSVQPFPPLSSSYSIISIPSTSNKVFTKIDSSTPSPAVDAKSLIEDSVDQANQLLIDLEEQIKLGINQGIEDDYEPLNIFSSSLPLSYGFKFSTSNFLFRPIFKATSVTSKLHSPTGTLDANDDIIDPPSTIDSIDTNNNNDVNDDNGGNNNKKNVNKQGTATQIQSMIDEVNRIEQNVETLITELVTNRRYVTAAVFRSLLNYLRRVRISLERLQSRMAIIGVGTSQQGVVNTISSGLSSSVSSIATSVSNSFLSEPVSGPLGGSSGGPSIATSYLEAIRVRMSRITDEIRTLIARLRLNFSSQSSPSSTVSSTLPELASSSTVPPSTTSKSKL